MGSRERLGSSHRMGAMVLAVVVISLTSVAIVAVQPASACSCAGGSIEDFREWSDAGFIGALVERGPADETVDDQFDSNVPHRFTVERWIFGDDEAAEITVYSPATGGGCGFELRVGERAAIFADNRGSRLVGGLCGTMPAEVALAQIEPAKAQSGRARLAVVGNFDGRLIAYFDDGGRFLGYDGQIGHDGRDRPSAVRCEDGRHVAVLEGLTIRIVSLTKAEDVTEPTTLDEDAGPQIARCRNPEDVMVAEHPNAGGLRLRELTSGVTESIAGPTGRWAPTNDGVAVVEHLDPGERLLLTAGGETREYGRLERTTEDNHRGYASLEASPDGAALGVLEVDYGRNGTATSTLRVLDAASGDELAARSFDRESWGAHWVDPENIAVTFGSDEVSHVEILDASTLASIDRFEGWRPHHSTLLDGVLWGIEDGTMYRAESGADPQAVFTFPARLWGQVFVLQEPIARTVEAESPTTEPPTTEPPTTEPPTTEPPTTVPAEDAPLDQAAPSQDPPEGGGLDTRLVGGSVIGGGAAIVGLLLLRQARQRSSAPGTSSRSGH